MYVLFNTLQEASAFVDACNTLFNLPDENQTSTYTTIEPTLLGHFICVVEDFRGISKEEISKGLSLYSLADLVALKEKPELPVHLP